MDATHILLGRPWQFDLDITYRGRLNQYVIQLKDRRIVLLPMELEPSKEKEKPNLLIKNKTEMIQEPVEVEFDLDTVVSEKE